MAVSALSLSIWLAICIGHHTVNGDILVYNRLQLLVEEYRDLPARFGPGLPSTGLQVLAVPGYPVDGCSPLNKPPVFNGTIQPKFAVIVARGACLFEDKVREAQSAGYSAVIVHNVNSNALEPMSAKSADDIIIPSLFIGEDAATELRNNYQFLYDDYFLVLNADLPFDINTHLLLPFSIVVGLCFLIMIGFMVVKCVRERRRMRRHRLPRRALKAIPIVKFNKVTMSYETCIICLDDYEEGDKLRVLPCDHAYHSKCIDVWLTKNRRVCPICKRKVLPKRHPNRQPTAPQHHHSDDSLSDSDADDTSPLLNQILAQQLSRNHGTFSQSASPSVAANQRVNPFDRSPNLPANLQEQQAPNASLLARLKRYIGDRMPSGSAHRDEDQEVLIQSTYETIAPSTDPSEVRSSPPRVAAAPCNNILNANLSGSFKDSDDDSSIYEPSHSLPGHLRTVEPQPSSSQQARLGVVAIPNMEFSPSPPATQSANVKPSNDFIV